MGLFAFPQLAQVLMKNIIPGGYTQCQTTVTSPVKVFENIFEDDFRNYRINLPILRFV